MTLTICPDCYGDGFHEVLDGGWNFPHYKPFGCRVCHGSGKVPSCESCGEAYVNEPEPCDNCGWHPADEPPALTDSDPPLPF